MTLLRCDRNLHLHRDNAYFWETLFKKSNSRFRILKKKQLGFFLRNLVSPDKPEMDQEKLNLQERIDLESSYDQFVAYLR